MKKTFIPYFLVLDNNAHFKYIYIKKTIGMKIAWPPEMECGCWRSKRTQLTGHHVSTLALGPLSNEISTSHRSHQNENTKQEKRSWDFTVVSDNTCQRKHDSSLQVTATERETHSSKSSSTKEKIHTSKVVSTLKSLCWCLKLFANYESLKVTSTCLFEVSEFKKRAARTRGCSI